MDTLALTAQLIATNSGKPGYDALRQARANGENVGQVLVDCHTALAAWHTAMDRSIDPSGEAAFRAVAIKTGHALLDNLIGGGRGGGVDACFWSIMEEAEKDGTEFEILVLGFRLGMRVFLETIGQ